MTCTHSCLVDQSCPGETERREGSIKLNETALVSSYPVKVVKGLAVFLDLVFCEALRVPDQDLVLSLVPGPLDGQQQG